MVSSLVLYALVGICPDWWPFPKFPVPGPRPPWWTRAAIGAVGGIIGGSLVNYGLEMPDLLASGIGAFAVSKLALNAIGNMGKMQG